MSTLFDKPKTVIAGFGHRKSLIKNHSWRQELKELLHSTAELESVSGFKIGPVFNGQHGKVVEEIKQKSDKPILYQYNSQKGLGLSDLNWKNLSGLILHSDQKNQKEVVNVCKETDTVPIMELKKRNFLHWQEVIEKAAKNKIDHYLLHHKRKLNLEGETFIHSCIDALEKQNLIEKPTLILDSSSSYLKVQKIEKAAESTDWHLIVRSDTLARPKLIKPILENFAARMDYNS